MNPKTESVKPTFGELRKRVQTGISDKESQIRKFGGNPNETPKRFLINQAVKDVRQEFKDLEKEKESKIQKEDIARLEKLASIDPLTGLLNRDGLKREIEKTIARAKRDEKTATDNGEHFERSYAIFFMDVNNLKQINDLSRDKHSSGDIVLKDVANTLKKEARPDDIIVRPGGDEFIVILESTDQEGAKKYWQRKDKQFKEKDIWISAGVVITDYRNIETSIEEADKAMYQAKETAKLDPEGRYNVLQIASDTSNIV